LASWLNATLARDGKGESEAPDLVAVGFQEMIPLVRVLLALSASRASCSFLRGEVQHLALAGFTSTALGLHEEKLKTAIEETHTREKGSRETYSLVGRKSLGGIALLLYSNDRTLTSKVKNVQVSTAGCGILNLMGNKGAVGIRLGLKGEEESWTFVTAHLAAHQEQVERRNRDWREIVQRLVFVDQGGEGRERGLYETGNLFVFGVSLSLVNLPSLHLY